jgi:uncharacterized membrane protein
LSEIPLTIKNVIHSKALAFRQSILFYPVIFSVAFIILFLITSRIDNDLFQRKIRVNIPYLQSLLFSGSPNAARSILSSISGGWTSLLAVTFSITLVILQLSSTKYTSHIVNEFENDKINQLTLGLFISVVIYSLLVLKTVQTDPDSGGITFTPIIGVNIAIFLAILSLFIFIIFLHNIITYIRPNALVNRIVNQVIQTTKSYEKRKDVYKSVLLPEVLSNNQKLYEIKSNREGILRSVSWQNVSKGLQEYSQITNTRNLWMEWSKSVGDWVEKESEIATIYNMENRNTSSENNILLLNNNNNNDKTRLKKRTLSSIEIGSDRDIYSDSRYGLELLRILAVRSINQFDTDVANSCVTGFFRILNHILKSSEVIGMPFCLTEIKEKDPSAAIKTKTTTIIIKPKETRISDDILRTLSAICNYADTDKHQISVIEHITNAYISISKNLLDINKVNEFKRLTEWYTGQLSISFSYFP